MSDTSGVADKDLPFFLSQNNGFGQIEPKDELLHPQSFADVKDVSATETQYFGFSVPEANIHALCYLWHHPNLKVCSGGLFVFQGVKEGTVYAELCDWRTYMSDDALKNDLHEFRLDNGYGVKIIEPLKRLHLTYADAVNKNSVDLMMEGVQPVVMFADGKHFEQTMQVKGELVLRGKRYDVDCFNIRDRSWGKPRPENVMQMPPNSWMIGVFNKDFAFNCTMFDQAANNPLLPKELSVPDDKALNGGWVYRDGKLGRIVSGNKRVSREPKSARAVSIELQITDDLGREFDLRATSVAACPSVPWYNMVAIINLMRWECDGLVGYGDAQEAFWGPYLNASAAS